MVISPLRALQRDEVLSLQAADGQRAVVAVNSDATAVQERGSWHELLVGAAGYAS